MHPFPHSAPQLFNIRKIRVNNKGQFCLGMHVFVEFGFLNFALKVQDNSLSNLDLDFVPYIHRSVNIFILLDALIHTCGGQYSI